MHTEFLSFTVGVCVYLFSVIAVAAICRQSLYFHSIELAGQKEPDRQFVNFLIEYQMFVHNSTKR